MLGSDNEVGGHRYFKPSANGEAIHCGNDWFRSTLQCREPAKSADAKVGVERFAVGRGAEIPACRKKAFSCTGQDRDSYRRVVFELKKIFSESTTRRCVERVCLWPVDRDRSYLFNDFDDLMEATRTLPARTVIDVTPAGHLIPDEKPQRVADTIAAAYESLTARAD